MNEVQPAFAGPHGTKGTVLVVEDEFITAAVLQENLRHMGYSVPVTVDNGEEAVRQAGLIAPDVVLMDVTLSGQMNGIAAARQIRDSYSVPVVFLTAHFDEATVESAKLAEPFGYIVKPY